MEDEKQNIIANQGRLIKNVNAPLLYKFASGDMQLPTEQSRKVSGYFSNFNSIDSDQDIIRSGAFAKSIAERGPESKSNRQIKYLHQHIMKELCGPVTSLQWRQHRRFV